MLYFFSVIAKLDKTGVVLSIHFNEAVGPACTVPYLGRVVALHFGMVQVLILPRLAPEGVEHGLSRRVWARVDVLEPTA